MVAVRRNLFDHYTQLENHITNCILTVLSENPRLCKSVIARVLGIRSSERRVKVLSQRIPKPIKGAGSVLDGTVYAADYSFCIGIENKIARNAVRFEQLVGHARQLLQFELSVLWVITPDELLDLSSLGRSHEFNAGCVSIVHSSWPTLVDLLLEIGPDRGSQLGKKVFFEFVSYMECLPNMTNFNGFRFDYGYDVDLARNYVKRVTPLLSDHIAKIYPGCVNTRQKYTGAAWDAWFNTNMPQESVHPGYLVAQNFLRCNIVLANDCRKEWRMLAQSLNNSPKRLLRTLSKVSRAKPVGSEAFVIVRQRNYPTQNVPVTDAETKIRIATLLGTDGAKESPVWLDLIKGIAETKSKRRINYQLEIGYDISYEKNQSLGTPKAVGLMRKAFSSLTCAQKFLCDSA